MVYVFVKWSATYSTSIGKILFAEKEGAGKKSQVWGNGKSGSGFRINRNLEKNKTIVFFFFFWACKKTKPTKQTAPLPYGGTT